MEGEASTAKSWSRTLACGLALICLFLGISVWFFARAAVQAGVVNSQIAGASSVHTPDVKNAIDQLKWEADKLAGPLLARLRTSPDDPYLLAEIGKTYYQMRQFQIAAKYYEDSARLKPDAAVFVKLGGACHFAGYDDKAIVAWNHALRLDPNNPDALFNIGFVKWHAQGNPKAAIAAWQKLLKTNPNHPRRTQVEELLAQAKQSAENPMAGDE